MSNVAEQVNALKTNLFGTSETTAKSYSLRLPVDLTAYVEAITEVSGKSRNIVMNDLLKLGVTCLLENLDNKQRSNINKAYEQEKIELYAEHLEGK